MSGFANTKCAAASGLTALRISGAAQILMTPSTPMTRNQPIMTGPNRRPMLAVPRRCIMNSPIRIASVSGKMKSSNAGVISFEALHGGKHGNRRRNHAVAVEERRSRDPEQDQNRKAGTVRDSLGRHQR